MVSIAVTVALLWVGCLDAVGIRRVLTHGVGDTDVAADQPVSDLSDESDVVEDQATDSVDGTDDQGDTADTAGDPPLETSDTTDQADTPGDIPPEEPDSAVDEDWLEDPWIDPDIDFGDDFDLVDGEWTELTSTLVVASRFGSSLAYSPESVSPPSAAMLIVGAPEDRSIGSIVVFGETRDEWRQVHRDSPSINAGALFGYSVTIFKETAFVGAPGVTWPGTGQGQAYLVDGTRGEWQPASALFEDEPSTVELGHSLSTFRRNLAIGAPPSNEVEVWNVDTGVPPATHIQPLLGPPEGAEFGFAVDCSGDRIAVGSPTFEVEEVETGSVVVYLRTAGETIETDGADIMAPVAGRRFGHDVALDVPDERGPGDHILAVGAPAAGAGTGVVYLYELDIGRSQWEPSHTLAAPPGVEQFGRAVAMRDGLLAIGGENHISVYGRVTADDWENLSPELPDGVDSPEFGFAVEVSEWQVFVGSPNADKVYAFELF